MRRHMKKVAIGATGLLAVAGAGGAIAATKLNPRQESQAVVNDAAGQLGVEPSALTAALKEALANRVDAAVAAGTLTKAQGDAIKQRIAAGEVPLVGLGGRGFGDRGFGRGGHHHHADLEAAASHLGMTEASLRAALGDGKTLAQVAKARNKSVDGLVAAMTKAETAELAAAVEAGRLTDAQRDFMVSGLKERITRLVNRQAGPRSERGFDGPPPALGTAA